MWQDFWVRLVSPRERHDEVQWQTVSPAAAAAAASPSPTNRPILPRHSGFGFGFGSGSGISGLDVTVASVKNINSVCVSYLFTQSYISAADSLSLCTL